MRRLNAAHLKCLTVSHSDDGVFAEHNCLTTFSGHGEFSENNSGHTSLNNNP